MKKLPKVKENAPREWQIPPLRAEDNKYARGALLILGGEALTGAARLAALAAQRAGAGLVTIAATPASFPIYAASLMSVMVRAATQAQWAKLVTDVRINPILIGPGAGVNPRTKQAMLAAAKTGKTLVLDADALTLLAGDVALRKALHAATKILTPHDGEYARLAKALKLTAADRTANAHALAKALNAIVVLKGADTIVADGVRATISNPPAWLATGGTGDVLAGIIAALVGQGMKPFDAASAGVWLHAEAARQHGRGMIAEDVIGSIPAMLRRLK